MAKGTYSAPSVKKAFRILHAVSDASRGLGVTDLSKQLRIGKSTVHGITVALEEMGALVREPIHKRFHVGYTLLELGRKAHAKMGLKDVARRPMESLMEKAGETIYLGVMNGEHVTILDVVESLNEVKITSPPGTRLPLLVGATGWVLLSQMEKEKAREIIQKKGLVRYTSKSITDPKQFLREVARAKEQGYAIDNEGYIIGVRAIAAPIQSPSFPPAAIWAVGFTSTLDDKKMDRIIIEIQKTVQEIHHSLQKSRSEGLPR